jgi:ATP-binding cassette subfamily F protein 3
VKASTPAPKVEKKVQQPTPRSQPEILQAKRDLKKLEDELKTVEDEIGKLEGQKLVLEKKMADPDLYSNESEAQRTQENYQKIQGYLEKINSKWEVLVDQISALQEMIS